MGAARTATIWAWLDEVPDPEIPVISVVDLGIIREVAVNDGAVTVALTPTYSGCPATAVIALDVEKALRDHGLEEVSIRRRLSPPWSTDWITERGRAKLKAYGIAPPNPAGAGPKSCPACGSGETERVSEFGSTPCKALYRCLSCAEPFDYFKCL